LIVLSQVTTYLASAPKSNASYLAFNKAQERVRKDGTPGVPLHLRNAPTQLMKEENYGKDYDYPHNHSPYHNSLPSLVVLVHYVNVTVHLEFHLCV
jgi:replication-associated recombination protein RarA